MKLPFIKIAVKTDFPEARRWLQQEVRKQTHVILENCSEFEELLLCLGELGHNDQKVLDFCKTHTDKNLFWIEWHVLGEPSTPGDHHALRRQFVSNRLNGLETAMNGLPHPANPVSVPA